MERSTAREELAWIRSLMSDSQIFLCGTWRHQMVWGVLGAVGLTSTWFAIQSASFTRIPWAWFFLVGLGWAYSMILATRDDADAPVRNVAGRAFGGIWMGLGITLTLLGSITMLTRAIDPVVLPGLIALVFGAGYFASGFLAGMRWVVGVAVAWWIGGVVLLFWRSPDAILALAGMTVLLEMGPALALQQIDRNARVPG